jgi:hypothetical protein
MLLLSSCMRGEEEEQEQVCTLPTDRLRCMP